MNEEKHTQQEAWPSEANILWSQFSKQTTVPFGDNSPCKNGFLPFRNGRERLYPDRPLRPKVSFLSGTLLRGVLLCSWASVNTARGSRDAPGGQELWLSSQTQKLLRNSDANSMERKEGDFGGGGELYL